MRISTKNNEKVGSGNALLEKFTLLALDASAHEMDNVDILQPIEDL